MSVVLFLATAATLAAQTPWRDQRVQRVIDQYITAHGGSRRQEMSAVLPQQAAAPPRICSVPLVEMRVPENVIFPTPSAQLKDARDHIQATVPAPPCPAR